MSNQVQKKVRVYAVGGAGINIASKFANLEATNQFATFDVGYIDTSRSNLNGRSITDENSYLFDKMDGGGKKRGSVGPEAMKQAMSILQHLPPADLNIIIHSGSGATGSTIGPSLVSEMKKKDKDVIVLMVGSTDSILETQNTFKTFETYDAISALRESSTIVQYFSNDIKGRSFSDKEIIQSVTMLLALYSGKHAELDSADLKAWLSYATISTDKPTIASLNIITKVDDLAQLDKVVSVATLATSDMITRLTVPVQYQCVGFVSSELVVGNTPSLNIFDKEPMHFVISFDALKNDYKVLRDQFEENTETLKAITKTNEGFSRSSEATDNGLVL